MAEYDLNVDTEVVKAQAEGMAVKAVTIDLEAYAALSRHRRARQSFSQVIREHFGRRRTGRDLLSLRERLTLSEETLDAIDAVIGGLRPPSASVIVVAPRVVSLEHPFEIPQPVGPAADVERVAVVEQAVEEGRRHVLVLGRQEGNPLSPTSELRPAPPVISLSVIP